MTYIAHSAGKSAKEIIFATRSTKKLENPRPLLGKIGNLFGLGDRVKWGITKADGSNLDYHQFEIALTTEDLP
ncbi:hypothetical protein H6H01_20680 [Nostoc calcicola FACHB-3891]|nr:hypothetical protein [Nostoc calcicola FACHB-3891]